MKPQETLRKLIMDEVFDQRLALHMLACLNEIKEERELIKAHVTTREMNADDALMDCQVKLDKSLHLLRQFAKVVENDRGADYHLLYELKELLEK